MTAPLSWQAPIVDPATGCPTAFFLEVWQALVTLGLGDLKNVTLPSNPADGHVLTLTYNESTKTWVGS